MNDITRHHRHTWQQAPAKARISDRMKTAAFLLFILAAYGFTGSMDYEDAVEMEAAQTAQQASSEPMPGEVHLAATQTASE